MFWGLTIEPGKHYSQTVDQSFHVSMAALDTREKSGITQLLVRHEKAEFLLCTLQYGDGIPYPCLQQSLNLNLSEGSEISFYSEGKGTIHLTGYLVMDEPIMEDPGLVAEANSLLNCSDEEEDYDSDEDDEEEEDDEEYSDSDMESTSSQDASLNWQQLINEFDGEDEDSDEDEWTPESAKKSAKKAGKEKKRKSQDDSMSDDLSLSAYKKKRKAAVQAETLSKMEIAADEGADDDEEDEEEEDDDFNPADDLEGEDDDDDEDDEDDDEDEDEEDEDEEEEEEEEEKLKSSPKKKAQTPKGKNVKSPSTSPQKVTKGEKADTESQETSESPLKKKKKKKKKQQVKQEEESKEEGDLPLKNLKTSNKENIEVQEKEKSVKKEQTPAKSKTLKKIKLPSGTTVEDIKGGQGKLAKPGKKVFMYYRGVLANSQNEFDSQLSGKPFMFCLGKGEVIKGWDAGIIGMKVGGKRRLTVPPSQAYGSQRVGPIPPNSTLIFDVELKSVR